MQQQENQLENEFKIPNWAGKPPAGTHLDVFKGDKLLQKLMIDEKRCYFFGRNPQVCDIAVEHASCSRVHAALVYHKHLNRFFLIDLGSAHGTYISNVRLESQKAEQVLTEQSFHFGASTRRYVLREKPTQPYYRGNTAGGETADDTASEKKSAHFLGLPEKEEELENLTEYNTALNRRLASMSATEETFHAFNRRIRLSSVHFKDEEEIINPEDVDPNVGKFRNLVQTAVIATKRQKLETDHYNLAAVNTSHHMTHTTMHSTHSSTTSHTSPGGNVGMGGGSLLGAKLGHSMLNIAPDIELYPPPPPPAGMTSFSMTSSTALAVRSRLDVATLDKLSADQSQFDDDQPKKKKYAKEAWPGKKPGHNLLM